MVSMIKKYLVKIFKYFSVFAIGIIYLITLTKLIIYLVDKLNKEFLCVSMTITNNIICFLVPIIIISIVYSVYSINLISNEGKKPKRIGLILKSIILGLVLVFVYSINNYTVVNSDKIIRHNIINSLNRVYKYSDIKYISIDIKVHGRLYTKLNYTIYFLDGFKVNLTNGILANKYNMDGIIQIDNIINNKKVKKVVDRSDFDLLIRKSSVNIKEKYYYLFK